MKKNFYSSKVKIVDIKVSTTFQDEDDDFDENRNTVKKLAESKLKLKFAILKN